MCALEDRFLLKGVSLLLLDNAPDHDDDSDDDDDDDDIYIMMQCLCVTKNLHFLKRPVCLSVCTVCTSLKVESRK